MTVGSPRLELTAFQSQSPLSHCSRLTSTSLLLVALVIALRARLDSTGQAPRLQTFIALAVQTNIPRFWGLGHDTFRG